MTREEQVKELLASVEWQMSNFMPAKGETSKQCERRRLIQSIADALDAEAAAMRERAADYLDEYAGGHYMAKSCASVIRSLPIRDE